MKIFSLCEGVTHFSDLPQTSGRLLIESTLSRPKLHALLTYGYLLKCAKNLTPVFVATGKARELIESIAPNYLGQFEVIEPLPLALIKRLYLMLVAAYFWVKVLLGFDLVRLRWRGLQVGDIAYDQYLAVRQYARLHRMDVHLLKYIYITLREVEKSEMLLANAGVNAVLLSHRVGIWAASLANAAQKLGIDIYSYGGDKYGTLIKGSQRKIYEYKVTHKNIDQILRLSDVDLDRLFDSVQAELLTGAFNADAKLAFSKKLYENRDEFSSAYDLPKGKRNVFVMLHAFTDYPHSHFSGMLFQDFYDWFIQTLEHAFTNTNVNWIIKSHPASHFYPVRDMDWDSIKSKYKCSHIAFMSEKADFDSRSIKHVGDAIVTCIGTAGFEFSALAGVPSITAGDNPYADSGFAIYPKSKKEYFQILSDIAGMERLKGERLRRAKATFVFIHRLSRVRMSSIPALSHAEHRYYENNDDYFLRVADAIQGKKDFVLNEMELYKKEIASPAFEALRTSPTEYLHSLDN